MPEANSAGVAMSYIDPTVLKKNPWNTNSLTPEAQEKLNASLSRLGMFKPIVVRTLKDGTLEVLGGEHRLEAALALGHDTVPVINVGRIPDKKAKEISLVDNGRYGEDDGVALSRLLKELGSAEELASFMPHTEADLVTIFETSSIDLEDLDLNDDDEAPAPAAPAAQPFQIMRFKVPVEDAQMVQKTIERLMREQGFTQDDSLTNAGMALVSLCKSLTD